jgi:hypothetical protein
MFKNCDGCGAPQAIAHLIWDPPFKSYKSLDLPTPVLVTRPLYDNYRALDKPEG